MTRIRRLKPAAHPQRDPIPWEPGSRPVNVPQAERSGSTDVQPSFRHLAALMIKVSPALLTALAALLAVILHR